ncbi:MAG: glycosyltransferase [Verrucomicrobiales bacterium]|nr:glycosyltransferase [Verrucomicrobiales bacterium]
MESFFLCVSGFLFLLCTGLLAHTYAIYPLLLKWLGRGKELPKSRFEEDSEFPEVAVLMAVYNEESVLETTLQSILESDYPLGKLRVWIGSDGSTDRSHEIIARFQKEHPELHLTVFGGRNGKIRIINQLAICARKVLENPETAAFLFCDANVAWAPESLRNMVRHFKRPEVGLVGAGIMDAELEHDGIGDQEEAYVGQENRTKFLEGVLWGNMMGAFGACYALRARLFQPVPESYIVDDYYQTMTCLESGHEAIVDLEAVCYESVSTDIAEEFRRKRRIATGNFQNLKHFWNFYLPWNGGPATSFAFWSHKGLRWTGPLLLIGATASSLMVALVEPILAFAFAGMGMSFLIAGFDYGMSRIAPRFHCKPTRFLRYFYAMNVALFFGFCAFLRGGQNSVWEPTKRVAADSNVSEPETAAER